MACLELEGGETSPFSEPSEALDTPSSAAETSPLSSLSSESELPFPLFLHLQ
jgi:hypothetical protein